MLLPRILTLLTKHLHDDPAACVSLFLSAHGVGFDNPGLDNPDIMLHLMNGRRAKHATPVRSEISRCVGLFVGMTTAVTETMIDEYAQGQLSSEDLRVICSVTGIKAAPHQRGHVWND